MAAIEILMKPATPAAAAVLASRLRAADDAEVRASTGRAPLEVVLEALQLSAEAWAVYFNDELACMWGVVDASRSLLTGRTGCAWLLTTDIVERHAKAFWRLCLAVLPRLLEQWDVLYNFMDVRHTQALRWAQRLGFRFAEPEPVGPAAMLFYPFRVTKEDLACAIR